MRFHDTGGNQPTLPVTPLIHETPVVASLRGKVVQPQTSTRDGVTFEISPIGATVSSSAYAMSPGFGSIYVSGLSQVLASVTFSNNLGSHTCTVSTLWALTRTSVSGLGGQ